MRLNVTRRDVLKFAGGSAVGAMLTPAPWKLIDDVAIWTQNWSWIPVPPKGPETFRTTACALCTAGCALKARCIGGLPVSLQPLEGDPINGAALCPAGLTAHHLPYHPSRLRGSIRLIGSGRERRSIPVGASIIVSECGRAIAAAKKTQTTVAVMDMRPGRAASSAWRSFLGSLPRSAYVPAPGREGSALATFETLGGGAFVPDLMNARTIVNFGAPFGEGWGSPRMAARLAGVDGEKPRLIHIEPVRSRTADSADRWLPARPGTEAILALGLGHVLLAENLIDESARGTRDFDEYSKVVAPLNPQLVANATGLKPADIILTAREMAQHRPSIVLAGETPGAGRMGAVAETAILGLNLLLGNLGQSGGYLRRSELPDPSTESLPPATELDQIADGSLSVLFVDASAGDVPFPWSLAQRKLAPGALVVALSPFLSGTAKHARYVVPTVPFMESTQELATPPDSPVAMFATAPALLAPREKAADPIAFLCSIAEASKTEQTGKWTSSEDVMKARAAQIHSSRRGTVMKYEDGSTVPVSDFASAEDLWSAFAAGARWTDEATSQQPLSNGSLLGCARDSIPAEIERATAGRNPRKLFLMAEASRDAASYAVVSPVMTKIYQESRLRLSPRTVVLNPSTARSLSLAGRSRATLRTANGAIPVTVALDENVMPGVARIAVGPDRSSLGERDGIRELGILDICRADASGVWRLNEAEVVEA